MASSLLNGVVAPMSTTTSSLPAANGVLFDVTSLTSSPSSTRPSTSATPTEERIVPTDDPDIQIIEGGPPSRVSAGLLGRCRKRPTPSNSIVFKDHLKNLVYNTTLQDHQNMMKRRGLTLNAHQTLVVRLRYIAEYVIRSLNEFGWAVVDNFLGDEHCRFTYNEIKCLYERGLFSAGQLMDDGKHKDEYHVKDIRSDQIYWFDGIDPRASDAATVRLLVSMIDSVIQHFKGRLPPYDISGRSRAMIAIYPGNGTRYVKHVDNPVRDGRCITTIYYCNEDWDIAKHGGTLRLYPESSMIPMDIDPKADRLVLFWSDRRNPHEVMPVFRPRFAITIWYMDREERRKAIEKQAEEAAESDSAQRSNDRSANTPPPIQRLGREDMRVFPSTSSEPSLAQLERSDAATGGSTSSERDASTSQGVLNASHAIRNTSAPRTSSLNSISDEDENPPPRVCSVNDYQI